MNFQSLHIQLENQVLKIFINRPALLNALNKHVLNELNQVLCRTENDKHIKAVIITGKGTKSFVAGADIKEFVDFDSQQGKDLSENGQQLVFDKISTFSKPVIALINGYALGGGLELAMACHLRIASENAKLGMPEVGLGLIPGYGGTQRLQRLVGVGKAFEMILTADAIDALEAYRIGLVNKVVSLESLEIAGDEMVARIIKNSPNALKNAISAINAYEEINKFGFEKEIGLFGSCFDSKDFIEGTNAFLEKRKPKF